MNLKKKDPFLCCLQEIHFRSKDRVKVKEWKKILHENGNEKKAEVAVLISIKIDFKTKTVTKDMEGHYVMIKGSIQQEDITFLNIYAPKIRARKYGKQVFQT